MLLPIPDRTVQLRRRQTSAIPSSSPVPGSTTPPPSTPGNATVIAAVVATAAGISLLFFGYFCLRVTRLKHPNPRYIPTEFLKRRWRSWKPGGLSASKGEYSARLQSDSSVPTLGGRTDPSSTDITRSMGDTEAEVAMVDVNRQTSVRSVMTLPAYSKTVRETEQLIAREGERDGVDVLIEASETAEEMEAVREEEMEALYQIREQRRVELAEREERRRRRREARERGDIAEVARIRQEGLMATQAREVNGASAMLAQYQSRSRERRVSSVSYADLGVARHDGTRVRANSGESERPLLDSAASIGGTSIRPWSTQESLSVYHRGRSSSAVSSISGEGVNTPPLRRSGSDDESMMSRDHSRNGSTLDLSRIDTADLGDGAPLYNDGFEEAPPYESPIESRRTVPRLDTSGIPVLPELGRLPSLRVVEATPIDTRPSTTFPEGRS